jgi:hypothetical protein
VQAAPLGVDDRLERALEVASLADLETRLQPRSRSIASPARSTSSGVQSPLVKNMLLEPLGRLVARDAGEA